jgi:type I restriction enzyme R subunit
MTIINALISIAQEIREARQHDDDLGLSEDETAFYDALANNKNAVEVMGDEQLAVIAREIIA